METLSVVPLVGFSPISHIGHVIDLAQTLAVLPGNKVIGISKSSGPFDNDFRLRIFKRQMGKLADDISSFISMGVADTLSYHNYQGVPTTLNIVVGHDRISFGQRIKDCLTGGSFKEFPDNPFKEIIIHTPPHPRTHGLSGMKMRQAAWDREQEVFYKHLGPNFSFEESNDILEQVREAIVQGNLSIKR